MPVDQSQYPHAMATDSETGKPMPKQKSSIEGSDGVIPVDIQNRLASTIQTHTNAVVAPSGTNYGNYASSWIDCDGFDKIALAIANDAATASSMGILWSHDGTNTHADETPIASSTQKYKGGITDIKARYARPYIVNGDTGAAHTINAFAYLKA